MYTKQLYAVWKSAHGSSCAVLNIEATEAVKHIYTYDGADYKLIKNPTEEGYNVEFKDSGNQPFRKTLRIAYGKDLSEAEYNLLSDSFLNNMWDTTEWQVMVMEDFLKYRQEYFNELIDN